MKLTLSWVVVVVGVAVCGLWFWLGLYGKTRNIGGWIEILLFFCWGIGWRRMVLYSFGK